MMTQRFIKLTRIILGTVSVFALTTPVFAAGLGITCEAGKTYISVFDMCVDFGLGISLGITWALVLGTLLVGIRITIGGIAMIMSRGDPGKLQNARETLTDSMVGLLLLASAWVILGYLEQTFPESWNINFLQFAP